MNEHYPDKAPIRVVLDNHWAHISKETMAYLAEHPSINTVQVTPRSNLFQRITTGAAIYLSNAVEDAFPQFFL